MSGRRPSEPVRERLYVENITVPAGRLRSVNEEAVARLADSFRRLGQRVPVSVRMDGDAVMLVAGLHRLRAAQALGWEQIEAVYCDGDETDARLWEIAENLHRAELSAVERAEHVAEWVRLTAEKVSRGGTPTGGAQPNEAGIRKAAAELGVSKSTAHRSATIAALPQDVRDQAREENWSQKRLLEAAAPAPPKPVPVPKNDMETEQDWRNAMMRLWNRAPDEWRERFIDYVQAPVFDRTRAGAA